MRAEVARGILRAVWRHSLANGFVPAINRTAERRRCDMGDFLNAMSGGVQPSSPTRMRHAFFLTTLVGLKQTRKKLLCGWG